MRVEEALAAVEAALRAGDRHALRAAKAALRAALEASPRLDPLLAAAARPHFEGDVQQDAPLLAKLDAWAAAAPPRSARAWALCTEASGEGHVLELIADLVPGEGAVWTPEAVARDTALAVQVAVAAALGAEAPRWGLRYQLRGLPPGATISGGSLGLAAAAAVTAARRGVAVPEGVAWTGGVDLSGRLSPVSGLPAKLRAAAAAGLHRVVLPDGAPLAISLRLPEGVEVQRALRLEDALASLPPAPTAPAPRPRTAPPWAALGAAVGLGLTALGALSPLDLIVQDGLQVTILGERPSTVTAVLAVPPEADLQALRPGWAAVVEALAAAGARAVVFDLVFSAALPGDAALAEALSAAPIPVVLAARGGDGPLRGPATEALAALPLGLVEVEHDLLLRRVRQGPVSRPDAAGAPVWNLAVAGLAAAEGGPPPRREADTLILGLRQVPIVRGRLRLAPTAAPLRVPLGGPLEAVAGRIVVVGAVDRVGDQHATAAGPRQGVEVIANFIETLAAGAGLRPLPLLAELGLVAAALSAQLGLGRTGGRAATRSAGLLGLALLALTALLLAAGQAFGPSAGLVGLGLCAWAQRAGAATGGAGTGRA